MELEASPFLASFLLEACTVHCLACSADGMVRGCNGAMAIGLKAEPAELVGRLLWDLLTEADATSLRQRVQGQKGEAGEKFLLNFVDSRDLPYTLQCRCEVRPEGFLLLGEVSNDLSFQEEWLHMNNQLAVLSRENARRGKELESARARLEETLRVLEDSYWHLKKIQEVLPLCMECGNVKAGAKWQSVADYLKENALFLSHGYCPDCVARLAQEYGIAKGEMVRE